MRRGGRGGPSPAGAGHENALAELAGERVSGRGFDDQPERTSPRRGESGRVRGGDGDDLVRSPCSEGIASFLGDEVAVTAVVEQPAVWLRSWPTVIRPPSGTRPGSQRSMVSSS